MKIIKKCVYVLFISALFSPLGFAFLEENTSYFCRGTDTKIFISNRVDDHTFNFIIHFDVNMPKAIGETEPYFGELIQVSANKATFEINIMGQAEEEFVMAGELSSTGNLGTVKLVTDDWANGVIADTCSLIKK